MRAFSCGVVIVCRGAGGCRYLLLRAYRHWDFPKGGVEPGEAPLAAALREVREETGLNDLQFPWGDLYRETAPYARGKVARYYLAELAGARERAIVLPVSPELGRPEHDEYRWLSYPRARALLVPRLAEVLDWARGASGCE
jgi:8-oxo-dGTP pyrophosphatase MutT (NUDIX family)